MTACTVAFETPQCRAMSSALRGSTSALEMISHRCRYKGRGSLLIRFFTSSIVRCAAARVILAMSSPSLFETFPPLFYHGTRIGIRGGVALSAKLLNEGLGLLDTREAHELAPQFDAPLLPMNTTSPLLGTIDGIAPVELIEQRVDGVLVAGDRVGLVQGQSRALDLFVGVA